MVPVGVFSGTYVWVEVDWIGGGGGGGQKKCILPERLSVLRFVSNKWVFHACSEPVCPFCLFCSLCAECLSAYLYRTESPIVLYGLNACLC